MKVCVLLSGGKDSVYNACICSALGHELVVAATLGPPLGTEEMDSYMYQTVGQDAVHLVAQAMQLPLYRRTIQGTAVDQALVYGKQPKGSATSVNLDETEDLYLLLQEVLSEHPEVNAVSVGAILSNYQRTRVEHVCSRLGLTSLAFLWQQDQFDLLQQMRQIEMSCAVIKVAGAGLNAKHVGQDVLGDFMHSELERLHSRFELHPCGEGGEYETFTLDCPLFSSRIELIKTEIVVTSPPEADRYSTVAYLRIEKAKLALKSEREQDWKAQIRDSLPQKSKSSSQKVVLRSGHSLRSQKLDLPTSGPPFVTFSDDTFQVSSVCHPCFSDTSLEDEAKAVFLLLKNVLRTHDLFFDDIDHINLYLSEMAHFSQVNAVYKQNFDIAPPSRACVALTLPKGCRILLTAHGSPFSSKVPRESLHVQSFSTWAPANIGPYSQAVRRGQLINIAGQIGLIPHTMQFPEPRSFQEEAILGLEHIQSIISTFGNLTLAGNISSIICWLPAQNQLPDKMEIATALWRKHNTNLPIIFREAIELPRGALIEWQAQACI